MLWQTQTSDKHSSETVCDEFTPQNTVHTEIYLKPHQRFFFLHYSTNQRPYMYLLINLDEQNLFNKKVFKSQ